MDGAQHRAVAAGLAQRGQGGVERRLVHPAQAVLAEESGDGLHLRGDGGVIVGEVGVVAARIDDAEHAAAQRKRQLFDFGSVGGRKVHIRKATDGAGRLVHQAAGLAEEHVLGVLAADGQLDRGDAAVIVEVAEDVAEHHLERGRRRQPRAGEHVGHRIGAEAPRFPPCGAERGADPRDERRGGPAAAAAGVGRADVRHVLGIALALEADTAVVRRRGGGDDVDVHRRREDAAVLVVGVVARDLGPPRHREQRRLAVAVDGNKAVEQPLVPRALRGDAVRAIQRGEHGVIAAAAYRLLQCSRFRHNDRSFPKAVQERSRRPSSSAQLVPETGVKRAFFQYIRQPREQCRADRALYEVERRRRQRHDKAAGEDGVGQIVADDQNQQTNCK